MFKNRILKRIGTAVMAGLCAFTLVGSNISSFKTTAAETTKEPLLTADEVIKQAATYLGVPYGWDCKGYNNVYSGTPVKQSMDTVRNLGLDCSGLVYATLTDLGVSTTGFSSNNPVPINYWEDSSGNAFKDCTMTYKGVTSPIEVLCDKLEASKEYFSTGTLVPGAIVSGISEEVGHMWIYMGEFNSRNDVIDYLVKLGFNKSNVSPYVGSGNDDGGKHWRIECNASEGCVINNNTDGKSRFTSFVAYRFTTHNATFSIKKCLDGTSKIVGKSSVDGSTAKYGVYSDKACKKKVGEIKISEKGTGSVKLPMGTYYVKELVAPTGYALSDEVHTLKANQSVTVYEDFERGNIQINKTSEDDVVRNLEFKVTGSDGSSYVKKTTAVGMVSFTGLKVYDMATGKPVKYNVSEINVATRYETPKAQNVTLVDGDVDLTVTVKFKNELVKGNIQINKQSEDGDNGDRTFEISGNGKSYTIKTNSDGIAILTDIPVYDINNKKIVYTISEKNVPIKYVVPANQTVTLTADETVTANFDNILKKFTAEVTKKDSESEKAQGEATLSGAVYGLYLDGKLVDEYVTDEKGYFKTKEYVCGDYTIKEISPSHGYLLDETARSVGAEPKNYTAERNLIPIDVTEDVIKGKIQIIKHSDDGTTQIETPEVGAEFQIYLKSAGSYENAKSSERDTIVCNDDGFSETKLLPYGLYTVHQTKGWENTQKVNDFDVTINENGKSYIFIINDAVITSYLKVVKKDAETGNIIPVSGIGFKIWSCDKSAYVVQTIKYPSEMTMDTFYTDETGTMMLPEKLVYGNYELHEVESAEGYVLDETAVPFVVDGTTDTVIVEKLNTPQKGKISVEKTGDIFTNVEILASAISKDDEGNIIESGQTKYSPVFEEKNLSGAVFNVIAVEDIVTADGTVRANKGDIVAELVTDENGYAETDLLYLGKYEVKEVTAPYGHVADTEPHYAELSYAGQTVAVRYTVNTSFFNEYQNVEISLEKVMEESEKFEIYGKDAYINVRFGLFADEEITAENGTTIPKDGFIAEVSLYENMTAKFNEKLPFGKYYVQEIATDEKYILNGEKYLVNFEYQGQEVTTVYINCGTFDNKIKYGKVSGIKVNEADEPIENAMFGLFDEACEEFTEETAIETVISDEKGYFEFNNIPFGKYIVHEIKSAEGYILSDENHFVNITEDGDVIEIKAVNDKIKGNVTVTKIDKDYPENKLSGAEFTVYTDENCEAEISKLSETEKGIYTLCDLEYGKYFLKETVAPDGFILDKNVYPFNIENDGETVEVSNTETGKGFINDAMCGKIKIVKTSSDGKLDGFQFRVTGVNYDQTFETDKNGEIIIENLRIGEYLISEVANHASASYVLPSDKTAVVKADATTIVEMYNEKRDTPGTGDNFNPTLWVLIAASCVICIAATGLVGYKAIKRKDK